VAIEKPFYKSNKFWYAVGGVVVVFAGHLLGMEPNQILALAGVAMMLIGGQTAADWGKHGKAIEAKAQASSEALDKLEILTKLPTLGDENKKQLEELSKTLIKMAGSDK